MNRKGLDMRRKHCAAFKKLYSVRTHRTQKFTNVVFHVVKIKQIFPRFDKTEVRLIILKIR